MIRYFCKRRNAEREHGFFRIVTISLTTMAATFLLLVYTGTERSQPVHVTEKDCLSPAACQYRPPKLANITRMGKGFKVSSSLQESVGIPMTEFINLSRRNVENFLFVTGASSNHLRESVGAIASVQKFMPRYKIIYYDLGLNKKEIDQEVLLTSPGVFWMDASVRLFKNFSTIYPQVLETGGFLQFWHSPHSNGAVTHPDQYAYFPTNVSRQEDVPGRAAGAVLLFRTKDVYWSVIHWWVMCALDEDCIAPKTARLRCNFRKYGNKKYADCHRYDQAALNLLSSNLYGYNATKYTAIDQGVVKIMKRVTSLHTIRICSSGL